MQFLILNAAGRALNRVVWDGVSDWLPPEGCTLIPDDGRNIAGADASAKPTTISARAFIARFSPDAQKAIFSSQDWQVQMFRALATAGDIDLTSPELAADLGYCAEQGLIPKAEIAAILTP